MEIFKKVKKEEWKTTLQDLRKAKICDKERLDSIYTTLKEGRNLFESDRVYLESKLKQLDEIKSKQEQEQKEDNDSPRYLDIIKKLHQKELGDFSRLELISNYLHDGMSILVEDKAYLERKYEELKYLNERNLNAKPQTILIDDFETRPTNAFDYLAQTISNIIKNSQPHFTIGIYGEWGTGKTTLMKTIERKLKDGIVSEKEQKVLTVWFNAWKYEREDNLASLSLLKTVAYAMADHEQFDSVSKTIFRGLNVIGKDLMQKLALSIVSKEKMELDEELTQKMDYMNKLYRESIYFDGLDKIKRQMEKIRDSAGPEYRVVVFIDDLDRCSSRKALEILESIKLFLDIEGFAFVIGLSHKTVTHLISQAYKATGLKGEDYIKKIIQIPIKVPTWSDENIIDLIENKISPNLNEEYTRFLRENSAMVAKVVEYNPRQLKRFINNVIIAFETFASKENATLIKFDEIFLVKIIRKEWPDFYDMFVSQKDFREVIRWLVNQPKEFRKYFKYLKTPTEEMPIEQKTKRTDLLNKLSEKTGGRVNTFHIDILSDFTQENWDFLANVRETLFGIDDWKVLDSVMDVVEEFSYEVSIGPKQVEQK